MGMEHEEGPDPAFTAIYRGVVTANDDPLKIGRVKARVPGLVEETDWALPIGHAGLYAVPERDDDVQLWFVGGDVDHAYYAAGPFAAPNQQSEAPAPVPNMQAVDAPWVRVLDGTRYQLVLDSRSGHEVAYLRDKQTGDGFTADAATGNAEVRATGTVTLHAAQVRFGDQNAAQSYVLGETYRSAEDQAFGKLIAALASAQTAMTALGTSLPPAAGACAAAATAIGAAVAQLSAFVSNGPSYLSTRIKGVP